MPGRVQKPRSPKEWRRATEVHEDSRTQRERERGQAERKALEHEMDDLLDEIDSVLEANAEELVSTFVQVGGE